MTTTKKYSEKRHFIYTFFDEYWKGKWLDWIFFAKHWKYELENQFKLCQKSKIELISRKMQIIYIDFNEVQNVIDEREWILKEPMNN